MQLCLIFPLTNIKLTTALSQGPKVRSAASIILRGPSDMYCDEMERSIHDALCVVKVLVFHLLMTSNFHAVFMLSFFSVFLSPSLWLLEEDVLRPPFPSILKTLQPLSHPGESNLVFSTHIELSTFFSSSGSNLQLLTLPSLCWSSPRPWLSTRRRTLRTW